MRPNSLLLMLLALTLPATTARAVPAEHVLTLHASVGEVVDAEEAARWGIFPELSDLSQVVFVRTAAGVLVARITLPGADGPILRERNVPAATWISWQASLASGERVTTTLASPPPGLVWPETALRADQIEPRDDLPVIPVSEATLEDTWVMLFDVGYKRSDTRFRDYFTDMMMVDLAVGYAMGERFTPFLGFQAGFGDLQDDFEDIAGDGKSAVYAFELGARATAPLSPRLDAVAAVAGGYYMRSLRWGGTVFLGPYGYVQGGAAVREFSDWGGSVKLGFQYALSAKDGRARYLDVGVRLERFGADRIVLTDPETDISLLADDHDIWAGVSVGLVFGL